MFADVLVVVDADNRHVIQDGNAGHFAGRGHLLRENVVRSEESARFPERREEIRQPLHVGSGVVCFGQAKLPDVFAVSADNGREHLASPDAPFQGVRPADVREILDVEPQKLFRGDRCDVVRVAVDAHRALLDRVGVSVEEDGGRSAKIPFVQDVRRYTAFHDAPVGTPQP